MNIRRAKERFWGAMFVESPVAKIPLVEFVFGLFSEKDKEESGESDEPKAEVSKTRK